MTKLAKPYQNTTQKVTLKVTLRNWCSHNETIRSEIIPMHARTKGPKLYPHPSLDSSPFNSGIWGSWSCIFVFPWISKISTTFNWNKSPSAPPPSSCWWWCYEVYSMQAPFPAAWSRGYPHPCTHKITLISRKPPLIPEPKLSIEFSEGVIYMVMVPLRGYKYDPCDPVWVMGLSDILPFVSIMWMWHEYMICWGYSFLVGIILWVAFCTDKIKFFTMQAYIKPLVFLFVSPRSDRYIRSFWVNT